MVQVVQYLVHQTDVLTFMKVDAHMSENTVSSEIVIAGSNVRNEIANLSKGQLSVFSTITGDGFAAKAALMEALSNSVPVSENLNKRIDLVNIVVESIDLVNEGTGELETQPRVIFIDDNGTAFHAISGPVFRDTQRLLAIMGHPSAWPTPVGVKITKNGQGTRQYFTLKLDTDTAPAKK